MNPDPSLAFTALLEHGGDEFAELDSRLGSYLVTDLVDYFHAGVPGRGSTLYAAGQLYVAKHRGQLKARAVQLSSAMRFPFDGVERPWVVTDNNRRRAEHADAALAAFAQRTGQNRLVDDHGFTPEVLDEIAGDLICGLMHVCARSGHNPAHLLARGRWHFEREHDGTDE